MANDYTPKDRDLSPDATPKTASWVERYDKAGSPPNDPHEDHRPSTNNFWDKYDNYCDDSDRDD
jgi:hypothetical protein